MQQRDGCGVLDGLDFFLETRQLFLRLLFLGFLLLQEIEEALCGQCLNRTDFVLDPLTQGTFLQQSRGLTFSENGAQLCGGCCEDRKEEIVLGVTVLHRDQNRLVPKRCNERARVYDLNRLKRHGSLVFSQSSFEVLVEGVASLLGLLKVLFLRNRFLKDTAEHFLEDGIELGTDAFGRHVHGQTT